MEDHKPIDPVEIVKQMVHDLTDDERMILFEHLNKLYPRPLLFSTMSEIERKIWGR